jgi:hypothetical protein
MSRTLEPFGNARTASMPAWIRSFGKNRSTTDAVRTALSSRDWIRISFSVARTNPYGTTAHGAKRPVGRGNIAFRLTSSTRTTFRACSTTFRWVSVTVHAKKLIGQLKDAEQGTQARALTTIRIRRSNR